MLRSIQSNAMDYGLSYAPKYVAIAPTPDRKHSDPESSNLDPTERRYNYKNNLYKGPQTASIARRNARERNRVKQVNDGFNALRKRIPLSIVNALSGGARRGSGNKLSKVDTLRMVVEYIKHLQNLLDESDAALGVATRHSKEDIPHYEIDEGVFEGGEGGRSSPYRNLVPSPASSDCSSGVSSIYSNNDCCSYKYVTSVETASPVNDNQLLDAISWWQQT